ncbi:MAG: hypothetical protein IKT40_14415 [Bacilli bacterium]|nr:hypothetical protein [Bacilli bacterium]
MKLTLYYNSSDINVMGKTLNYVIEINGYLRQMTSILSPIIDIEVDSQGNINYDSIVSYTENDIENDIEFTDDGNDYEIGITFDTNILKCNYAHIQELNRYYFIDDIVIKSTNIYTLVLKLDVLETYRTYLLNQYAMISRNEFTYNNFLDDKLTSYYYNKQIEYHDNDYKISGDFSFNTSLDRWCYVWTKLETNNTTDRLPLDNVDTYQTGNTENTSIYVLETSDDLSALSKTIVEKDVLLSYVKHLVAYPFQPQRGAFKHLVYILNSKISGIDIYCADAKYSTEKISLGVYRIPIEDTYLGYYPYTKYEIWLPYYGWVELSGETLSKSYGYIEIYYIVNYATAETNVFIKYAQIYSDIIFTSECTLGVDIPLDATNRFENDKRKEALRTSTAISLLGSIVSTGMGYATSNPSAMASGIMSGVKTLADAQTTYNQLYEKASVNITKGEFGVFNQQNVKIRITKVKKVDNNLEKYYGKPLNETKLISELKGFTQIAEIHYDNLNATNQEISMLDGILKKGFIIE